MAQYDINLSNGTVLAILYPLETNGPDNRSTPRLIKSSNGTTGEFTLTGDLTYRFVAGFQFDVQNSGGLYGSPSVYDGNDGTYTVAPAGSVFVPGPPGQPGETIIPVVLTGSPLPVLSEVLPLGQIQYTNPDVNTTIKLPGKGTMNYGENIIENLVHITENFAADNSPDTNTFLGDTPFGDPLVGQLWYNTTVGEEGFLHYDGTDWTRDINIGEGIIYFTDPENTIDPTTQIILTGTDPVYPDEGLSIRTLVNPTDGEPILRIMSSGGTERLRVEHNGEVLINNNFTLNGSSTMNGDVTVVNSDVIFNNGYGIESAAGALVKTGPGGKTWQVYGVDNTAATFVVNDSTGIVFNVDESAQVVAVGNDYNFFVDTDTLFVDAANDRVGVNVVPTYPLDVVGNSRILGRVGINNVPPSGTVWLEVTGDIQANSQFRGSDQSAVSPTYSFTNDLNSGMYSAAADQLGWSVNGIAQLTLDVNALSIVADIQILADGGTSTLPGYSFVDDTDTGFYHNASGSTSYQSDTTTVMRFTGQGIEAGFNGSAATPFYTWISGDDSGMYRTGGGSVCLSTAGTKRLEIGSTGALLVDGTSGYETLVTTDDVIPNKKYVDDSLTTTIGFYYTKLENDGTAGSAGAKIDKVSSDTANNFAEHDGSGGLIAGTSNASSFAVAGAHYTKTESDAITPAAGAKVDKVVGVSGNVVEFGASNTIADSGIASNNIITAVGYSVDLANGSPTLRVNGNGSPITTYTNSTGAPMTVYVRVSSVGSVASEFQVNGTTISAFSTSTNGSPEETIEITHSVLVPNASTYAVIGGGTIITWFEVQ